MKNEIIQGDSLEVLKTLPAESIDCCITSPPYWGLRDYGTAKWEGGNEECDHIESAHSIKFEGRDTSAHTERQYQDICQKCGAKRIDNQIGLEKTPEEYVQKLVQLFSEVKRVLKKEGTLWLNLGDSYATSKEGNTQEIYAKARTKSFKKECPPNLKQKDLVGIPWRVAFALQKDGWWLRQDIIWHKPNPMPESVTDRCTKSHEYIFLLAKSQKYYFDNEAIMETAKTELNAERPRMGQGKNTIYSQKRVKMATPFILGQQAQVRENHDIHYDERETYGQRNKRSVWTVTTKPFKEAHFATFPEDLIIPMIKAGCPEGGLVLDPFMGAGTTAWVAKKLRRNYLGIELNPKYIKIAQERIKQGTIL